MDVGRSQRKGTAAAPPPPYRTVYYHSNRGVGTSLLFPARVPFLPPFTMRMLGFILKHCFPLFLFSSTSAQAPMLSFSFFCLCFFPFSAIFITFPPPFTYPKGSCLMPVTSPLILFLLVVQIFFCVSTLGRKNMHFPTMIAPS